MTDVNELSYERLDAEAWLKILSERKSRDRKIAKGVQTVMRVAYTEVFEGSASPFGLKKGTIKSDYFNEKDVHHVDSQRHRMESHILGRQAIYWLAWGDDELYGLAKTSPSKLVKPGSFAQPNCYLNDIAVTTEGIGVGSALLGCAVGDYSARKKVVLDAYQGNEHANEWFSRRGFSALETQPPGLSLEIGGIVVPQLRMVAPSVRETQQTLHTH